MQGASKEAKEFALQNDVTAKSIELFELKTKEANKALVAETMATSLATKAKLALSAAMKMVAWAAVTTLILKAVEQIKYLATANQRAVEKAKELKAAYDQLQSAVKDLEQELSTIRDRMEELSNLGPLTLTQQAELTLLQEQSEELQRQLELKRVLAQYAKSEAEAAALEALSKNTTKSLERTIDTEEAFGKTFTQKLTIPEAVEERLERINELHQERKTLLEEIQQLEEGSDDWWAKQQEIEENEEAVLKLNRAVADLLTDANTYLDTLRTGSEEGRQMAAVLDELNDGFLRLSGEGLSVDLTAQFNQIFDTSNLKEQIIALAQAGDLTADTLALRFPEILQHFDEVGISAEEAADHINASFGMVEEGLSGVKEQTGGLSSVMNDAFSELSKMESGFQMLAKAEQEFNNEGEISVDTLQNLINNDLVRYLEVTADGLRINTDELDQNRLALIDQTEAALKTALGEDILKLATEGVSDEELKLAKNTDIATAKLGTFTERLANLASNAVATSIGIAAVNAELEGTGLDLAGKEKQVNALVASYQATVASLQGMSFATSDYGSRLRETTKATNEAKDAQKDYEQALKSGQDAIQDLISTTISMLKQQMADAKEDLNNQIETLTQRYNDEREQIQETYQAAKKRLDREKKDLQKQNQEVKKSYDSQKKYENELYEQQKKRYDQAKQAIKDELDAYREKINLQLKALDKEEGDRGYEKGLAERQKAVSDIEKQLLALQFDSSEAANKKRQELYEQLSKAQLDLEEYQRDRSVELQKDALNQSLDAFEEHQNAKLDALEEEFGEVTRQHEEKLLQLELEHQTWTEYYEGRLEAIETESEQLQEKHEQQLARMEKEYKESKKILQQQIKDIDEKAKNEVAIRNEAIRLIEERSEEFYDNLIQWNQKYGITGAPLVRQRAWKNYTYMQVTPKASPQNGGMKQAQTATVRKRKKREDGHTVKS